MQNTSNRLKEALIKKEFVVTCEVIPGRGAREPEQEHEFAEAQKIWNTGLVHAISITDNPGGKPALLADAVADEFARQGLTPLVHFTCKDRNRAQIQSQLYALEREGLSNILVMSGDYPVGGWEGRPRPVFDLDPVQTLMFIKDMNSGLVQQTPRGERQEQASHFFAGAVVNPFKYTEGEVLPQYAKLDRKIFAGAEYIITQLGYDMRKLDELQRYVHAQSSNVALISNVFVLTLGAARLMRKGIIAGCHVSDELFALLEEEGAAEDKGKAARLERAAQMVAVSKGMGFAGVHIGGMGLNSDMLVSILARSEELKNQWQELASQLCFGESDGYYYYEAASAGAASARGITTTAVSANAALTKDSSNNNAASTDAATINAASNNDTSVYAASAQAHFALNSQHLAHKPEHVRGAKIMRTYGLSRFFHHLVLTPNKGLYGVLKSVMASKERKKGMHRAHAIEHLGKTMLYGCMDCGDCGLETCIYSCPMTYCPKCQRNGPCGGSMSGWCEVYPEERYCIWFRAYHRLKKYDETEKLYRYITPPNNWDYFETSGWSNYTHERDNAARRIVMKQGN